MAYFLKVDTVDSGAFSGELNCTFPFYREGKLVTRTIRIEKGSINIEDLLVSVFGGPQKRDLGLRVLLPIGGGQGHEDYIVPADRISEIAA